MSFTQLLTESRHKSRLPNFNVIFFQLNTTATLTLTRPLRRKFRMRWFFDVPRWRSRVFLDRTFNLSSSSFHFSVGFHFSVFYSQWSTFNHIILSKKVLIFCQVSDGSAQIRNFLRNGRVRVKFTNFNKPKRSANQGKHLIRQKLKASQNFKIVTPKKLLKYLLSLICKQLSWIWKNWSDTLIWLLIRVNTFEKCVILGVFLWTFWDLQPTIWISGYLTWLYNYIFPKNSEAIKTEKAAVAIWPKQS